MFESMTLTEILLAMIVFLLFVIYTHLYNQSGKGL